MQRRNLTYFLILGLAVLVWPLSAKPQAHNALRVSRELVQFTQSLRLAGQPHGALALERLQMFKRLSPAQQGRLMSIRDTAHLEDALLLLQDTIDIDLFSVTELSVLYRKFQAAQFRSESFQNEVLETLPRLSPSHQEELLAKVHAIQPMRSKSRQTALDFLEKPDPRSLTEIVEVLNAREYERFMTAINPFLARSVSVSLTLRPSIDYIENFYRLAESNPESGVIGSQVYLWLNHIRQQLHELGALKQNPETGIFHKQPTAAFLRKPDSLLGLEITLRFFRNKFNEGYFKPEIEAFRAWQMNQPHMATKSFDVEVPDRIAYQTTCWAIEAEAILSSLEEIFLRSRTLTPPRLFGSTDYQ